MSPPASLAIVLPAYNEAERIGPALDELFGYLRRRGERARDGRPGAGELPERIEVLVVDDGSTDGTADIVRARREAEAASTAPSCELLTVPHGGKGAAVRAGMLAADADLVVFADADMATPPDQLPLLVAALDDHDVALGSRIQPDGSDMRTTQPAYRRALGKAFHAARLGLGRRPGPGHPVRVQGLPPRGRARPVRAASGSRASSSTSSSSTSPAAAAIASRSCRSAGPTGAARGCAPGPAWPSGSPGTCSGSRSSTAGRGRGAGRAGMTAATASLGPLARAALPIVAMPRRSRSSSGPPWRSPATRCGYDFLAYHQAARRLLDGQPRLRPVVRGERRVRPVLLPADVRPARPAVRAAVGRRGRLGLDRRCSSRRSSSGVALLPVSRTVRWWIVLLAGLSWPFLYAVKLGQVGPLLFLLFAVGWRWLDDPVRLGAEHGALGAAIKIQPGSSSSGRC